jgi:hypothetical protein
MTKNSRYPLKRSFILDSGTTCHVANDIDRFTNTREPTQGDFLWAGNTRVWIKAYGTVVIRVQGQATQLLRLNDVAYCPDLHCNLVSFRILRQQGLWWDTKSNPTVLRRHNDTAVAMLQEQYGQWVIEYNDMDQPQSSFATTARTQHTWQRAKAMIWHKRMGHPGPQALEHLVHHSEGVKIVGLPTVNCDACGRSKSKRLIRRAPREIHEGPGERVAIDFHDFEDGSNTKEKTQMLIMCRATGFLWDFYLKNHAARSIVQALQTFVRFMKTQFNITVAVIETDNEMFRSTEAQRWKDDQGIAVEPSAPDTQAQNGGAERSGGVIKEKSRAMRLDANLPWELWPEVVRSAVYLYNRTPRYSNHWRSPYEDFFTRVAYQIGVVTSPRKPNQSHLRTYGCKAFAMTDDTKRHKGRLQRLDPKAWIGYLVGYRSSNIFRVWIPSMGKVISTRDVVFDEYTIFDGSEKQVMDNLMHSTLEEIKSWIRTVELPPSPQQNSETNTFYEDEAVSNSQEGPLIDQPQYDKAGRKRIPYPTPPSTPHAALLAQWMSSVGYEQMPPAAAGSSDEGQDQALPHSRRIQTLGMDLLRKKDRAKPVDHRVSLLGERDRLRSPLNAQPAVVAEPRTAAYKAGPTARNVQANPAVVAEPRTAAYKAGPTTRNVQAQLAVVAEPWAAAFIAGLQAGNVQDIKGVRVDDASMTRKMMKGYQPQLRELPPPPSPNGLKLDHLFYNSFKKAEEEHLESHKKTESWTEVPSSRARREGIQILDSMWVYTYKLDELSRLKKCKARLVVRGDQQNNVTAQETYAATLTGRSFRMLMAIAARFGLDLRQFDVTNAFVHAPIDRLVYMQMPRGYVRQGTILQLDKALYGLRISPLLWHKDITEYLMTMGFMPVPHEPCCMTRNGVFIFFYVDDIILGNHPDRREAADKAVEELKKKYTLTGGEPLKWFLGLEVIRDLDTQKLWLSQAAYIDKINRLVTDRTIRHDTPMSRMELLPRKDLATHAEINLYQRKIGSLLFLAVNTRPDVAFATSRLARFLTNPSTKHQQAADRVLLYVHLTRTLGLQFGGSDELVVASDASFADNTVDRKSSQGFILKLFGGAIAWRANKQDTVTTSTTEAELLSLAQAAKEAKFLVRLQAELGIKLADSTITIQCDNKQTIRLVNEKTSQLTTKLRHVDIHNHWLRQEAQNGKIEVIYTPTNDMIADGFTKSLPANKMCYFLEHVGLVDIKDKLVVEEGQMKEILDRMERIEVTDHSPSTMSSSERGSS